MIHWLSLAFVVAGILLAVRALPGDVLIHLIRDGTIRSGAWGVVGFGLLYVAAVLVFVPAWIFSVGAGAIYGLVAGGVIALLSANLAAAAAFFIARYLARERVTRLLQHYPRFQAIQRALGVAGWRIVVLLRLSPMVPFSLQNYLYGLTTMRFWPCQLVSFLAMLPGTLMFVYVGYVGGISLEMAHNPAALASGRMVLTVLGLVATLAATFYLTHLAQRLLAEQASLASADESDADAPSLPFSRWLSLLGLLLGVLIFGVGVSISLYHEALRESLLQALPLHSESLTH